MARPEKAGLDYFPLDVGFLRDKKVKLLKTEFGACSVIFVLYVLGRVYEEEGYYLRWDKDECLIAAEAVGCGSTPSYIGEVLQRCLSRSLFDQRVFQMFGVLTSAGIQRRYLRGREKRGAIEMIEEYFLLDVRDPKDVPAGILAKLTLKKVFGGKNEVISPENEVNSPENPQIKLNEMKLNKKRERTFVPPTQDEVAAFCKENGYTVDAGRFVDYYTSIGWMVGNRRMTDWQASVRNWERRDAEAAKKAAAEAEKKKAEIGFDLDEFFEAATRKRPKEEYGKKEET